MPAIHTPSGALIYFAHCPKAGGSSVEDYLLQRYGEVGLLDREWNKTWRLKEGWRSAPERSSPQHLIWEEARPRLPRAPDHVFAVVRDPVARMVSEYGYQRSRRRTGRFGRGLGQLDFSTWLRVMLNAAARDPYLYDNHFRPQSAFLPPEGVTVFRLEEGLAPVAAWLDRVSGSVAPEVAIPHAMRSRKRTAVARRQDLALIASAYAADYERFGYSFPDLARARADMSAAARTVAGQALGPVVAALYRRGRL